MDTRTKYNTKQRKMIISCLKTLPGVHVTAGDLYRRLKANGISIGQTTIYRQLENLVDEGLVNKYIIDENSPACFVYEESSGHEDADQCFHCKCEQCGKLIHLHCEELAGIEVHLLDAHRFKINPMRTVFYGICEDCLNAN